MSNTRDTRFEDIELDPDIWEPTDDADDIVGQRRSWIGKEGTDWAGCTLSMELTFEDEGDDGCHICHRIDGHKFDCPVAP